MQDPACICLIDDDIIVLKALATGLRDLGHVVWTAPGAAAALDLMMRERVDVIVTDVQMPGVSGSQLIAQARAKHPDLPIVAMSGAFDGGPSVHDLAHALGVSAVLAKPFRARSLSDLIKTLPPRPLPEQDDQLEPKTTSGSSSTSPSAELLRALTDG